jgi:hypothetical protein
MHRYGEHNENTRPPMSSLSLLQDLPDLDLPLDGDRFNSAAKVLERLSEARNSTSKEANKFLLLAVLFSVFYLVKVIGLRVDLVLLDQKIFEIPYGIFIFSIISQGLFVLSLSRAMDARVFDRNIKAVCNRLWKDSGEFFYSSVPNPYAWMEPTANAIQQMRGRSFLKIFGKVCYSFASIFLILLYSAPIITGIHFLTNFDDLKYDFNQDYQYYSVVFLTILSLIWLLATLMIYAANREDVSAP